MFSRYYPVLFLLANGLVYLVLAWLFFSATTIWFGNLGIELTDEAGYTELRATYIGLFAGLGVFFLLAALRGQWRSAGMVLALLTYLGLALVRGYGVFVLQQGNELMDQLLFSEVLLILLSLLGLYCLRQQRKQYSNPYR